MKNYNPFAVFSLFLLLIGSSSCLELSVGGGSFVGRDPFPPPAGVREALLQCGEGEHHKMPHDLFNILEFNEHLVFYGEKFFVTKKGDQDIVFEKSIQHTSAVNYQGQVVLCTEVGLFTLDADMNFDLRNSASCRQLKLGPAGELLFIPAKNHNYPFNMVQEIDPSFSTITPYTIYSEDIPAGQLLDFMVSPNGLVWGWTNKGTIVQFENRKFKEVFSSENAPLFPEGETNVIFFLPYQNKDLVVATTQRGGGMRLIKYTDGNWITLKDFTLPDVQNAVDSGIGSLALFDAMIIDHQLYLVLSYSLFLRADISVDQEFLPGEFILIDDPVFDGKMKVGGFSQTGEGAIYFHHSSGHYMVFSCG